MSDAELPGLDLEAFRAYFEQACPGEVTGPLSGSLVAGGKSNLTYIVGDGRREWVGRRPPLGHVPATAHGRTLDAIACRRCRLSRVALR